MSSTKRKGTTSDLNRRVRARRGSSEELDLADSASPLTENQSNPNVGDNLQRNGDDGKQTSASGSKSRDFTGIAPPVSFGALAKAQASISQRGDKGSWKTAVDDTWENHEEEERHAGRKDHRDFTRSSKHAPTEISSKKAVSRKRDAVPVAQRQHRDPRFESLSGDIDDSKLKKAYAFLDGYRADEIEELKVAIRNTKDDSVKERLKRELASMESRRKAQMRKDKEQEILDRHRKEEKELVKQGKQPFYLKRSEQKQRVLLDRFGDLKGKQLDRVIERRRKKVEGKEKKKLPFARREALE